LLEEDLPLDGRGLGELRRSGRSGRLGALPRRAGVLAGGLPLLLGALRDDGLRAPRRARLEGGAGGLRAGHQLRIVDAAGARTLELGDERAARIGCDRRDRARTGTQAEPMQGQRGLCLGFLNHGAPPLESPGVRRRTEGAYTLLYVALQLVAYGAGG